LTHIRVPEGLPGIRSLLAFRPETAGALSALADVLLHSPGTLTLGERELIAARVSALNQCTYCCASHAAIAGCHLGGDYALVDATVADPSTAAISNKMKALLVVAEQVQQGGRHVRAEDVERARQEGATDVEIHDTVLIAAAFCMFNRYVDGLGTFAPTDVASYRERAGMVAEHGYSAALPSHPTQARR